ncbi:phage tail protein [Brachyspira pilosicoli]|uniref:phage tail protein n=1 Tax=Brachyspira pilosicoli TaxID=52584 RepID=UPI0030066B6B
MFLNENNLQAPFQYKISENSFNLEKINNSLQLSKDNSQIKVFEGEKLFCVDIGYGINGALEEMEFILDGVRVYPVLLDEINCIRELEEVEENKIYLIKNDINFKSIIFLSINHLNKKFEYSITAYNTTLSSWMFDYIAKKINSLDTDYPIKNYYNKTNYKINDIIKHNGYLYKVNKDFLSDDSDYYLESNCSILTPFKSLEIGINYNAGDILEYKNKFFAVSENFVYREENDIYDFVKPLIEIINWFDGIKRIYKNQIIIKNGIFYLVLDYAENPVWNNLLRDKKIEILSKASNIFYDDSNTSFGDNTNNLQLAIEKLKKDIENKIPTGSSNLANNILYDNSKTNLVYKTEEYDFPRFKYNIPENIELLLNDGTNNYIAAITKQEDGSYILSCNIENTNKNDINLIIKSIDGDSNIYKNYSIINQFFNFNELYDLEEIEININTKIKFVFNSSNILLQIINVPLESNIFLRLKNRELRNQDKYLFGLSEAFMGSQTIIDNYILEFVQDNNTVKLSGSYTLKEGAGAQIIFYNPIVENYFNIKTEFSDTTGIISSSGKLIKYTISKANKDDMDVYLLFLQYEDDDIISAGEKITFNLTPDKNFILNKALKPVENVQELGESLALRYMIAPYYVQYPDVNGNFNNNEEPSVWFKKMYNVATTWQIIFNDKSAFFRTEGSKSGVARINGLQPYGMPNLSGAISSKNPYSPVAAFIGASGVFSLQENYEYYIDGRSLTGGGYFYINMNTNKQIKEYTNDLVVDNYQKRIYKLLSINGQKVSDIIEGV